MVVEFALILLPLLLLVVGIVQFGIAVAFWQDQQRLAAQGARVAIVNCAAASWCTPTLSEHLESEPLSNGNRPDGHSVLRVQDRRDHLRRPPGCRRRFDHRIPRGSFRARSALQRRHDHPVGANDDAPRAGCDQPRYRVGATVSVRRSEMRNVARRQTREVRLSSSSQSWYPSSSCSPPWWLRAVTGSRTRSTSRPRPTLRRSQAATAGRFHAAPIATQTHKEPESSTRPVLPRSAYNRGGSSHDVAAQPTDRWRTGK